MRTPAELAADPAFPWNAGLVPKTLLEPHLPEPPRAGETAHDCPLCSRHDDDYLWTDDDWRLLAYRDVPLRGCVILEARQHADSFADLSPTAMTSLGPTLARVERAVLSIGDVGRVHVARWGEGIAHFHQWVMPRPAGALQLRGPRLMAWMDALSDLPRSSVDAAHAAIGRAMHG
jgi:diadenosine tetraphosphate (Ap4A) HIT family hydrolase